MLNPEEIPCFESGFDVFEMTVSFTASTVTGFPVFSTFFSSGLEGFTSWYSLRKGASIKNFFF
ncbi:hypothetical protein ACM39_08270 [Chryseobacterium sp. FH2]|uniref:hypothetical protein n=1 Tax=Chryseobacterium sp. FH2 TaxID=1674291 RepID=UPI00065AC283|nr:hypothetical protein [Chryseobacterium sp. FH2]KMQ68495.1 hypothetical protein ACM39_08270 [Chryseobacterium sp. FH2]